MDASIRGLPLLSGPPPPRTALHNVDVNECMRCKKEYGIFNRSKTCMHCGYGYCSSCCDHQALMPRMSGESGYEVVQVCAFCIDHLSITAAGKNQLKEYHISKLKGYLKAYGIPFPPGALEKEDFVQAVLDARGSNGCLPAANEAYYRRSSIPSDSTSSERPRRNLFSRINETIREATGQGSSSSPQVPPPVPQASRPGQPRPAAGPPYHIRTAQQSPRPNPPRSTRPTSEHPLPPRSPTLPIPSLSDLLALTTEQLSALSSHTLKEVLHQNHVNARLILEKSDLVDKVKILLEAERMDRQREEDARRMEEEEAIARQHILMADLRERENRVELDMKANGGDTLDHNPQLSGSPKLESLPTMGLGRSQLFERQGLCIICQDTEANMAIVDCGHLAMCMPCSELVMQSSRECPLCRTRIVTPERILRIFKT